MNDKITQPTIPTNGQRASTQNHYTITADDLPLSCPLPNMRLWDAHPRVYLQLDAQGKAVCPYCDAQFTLAQPS